MPRGDNPAIPTSRSEWPNISSKATRSAVFLKMKPSVEHGLPLTRKPMAERKVAPAEGSLKTTPLRKRGPAERKGFGAETGIGALCLSKEGRPHSETQCSLERY